MEAIYTGDFKELSMKAMNRLLLGDNPYFYCLRQQLKNSKMANFKYDGYGYTVDLIVDPLFKIISPKVSYDIISGVCGINEKQEDVCGFALFVNDGCLTQLDAYPIRADEWPKENVSLMYSKDSEQHGLEFSDLGCAKSIENLTKIDSFQIAAKA